MKWVNHRLDPWNRRIRDGQSDCRALLRNDLLAARRLAGSAFRQCHYQSQSDGRSCDCTHADQNGARALLFRGRQGRTCRLRRGEASGGRSLSGGGAYRLLVSALLGLRKRLCSAGLAGGVLSVLRPCGAGTVRQGLNRGLGCRRWRACSSFRSRLIGLVCCGPGSANALWRPARPAPARRPPDARPFRRKPSRRRVARDQKSCQ